MTKISDLTALTGAGVDDAADLLTIVDMSEAGAARNKKITIDETRIALGLSSADSPQFTALNLGHASDTTITRVSAGVAAVEGVNIVTTAGGVTFAADISVPDEAYDATAWNGSLEVPTKNAVRDKIESISAGGGIDVEDEGTPEATGATTLNFVGAGVTAADVGGGVVDVTISGGGGGIDVEEDGVSEGTGITSLNFTTGLDVSVTGSEATISASGGSGYGYEDSPTIPDLTGFTFQNAGSATATAVARGVTISAPTSTNLHFVRKNGAPPATPYSVIVRGRPISARHGAAIRVGVVARNNTSGRLVVFGDWDDHSYLVQRWSSYTAVSANALLQTGAIWFKTLPWRRMTNDGTNLIFGMSPDGENWLDIHTEPLATFINAAGGSVDEIGFGTSQQGSGFTTFSLFQSCEVV